MKRAILAVSAALLLLTSAPALADGYRHERHGFGHDFRQGRHFQPHHFGGFAHRPYFRPPYFAGFVYGPHFGARHHGGDHHRPHFRRHGGRHFSPHHFGGHRHRH